jgi:hypothetical protein
VRRFFAFRTFEMTTNTSNRGDGPHILGEDLRCVCVCCVN